MIRRRQCAAQGPGWCPRSLQRSVRKRYFVVSYASLSVGSPAREGAASVPLPARKSRRPARVSCQSPTSTALRASRGTPLRSSCRSSAPSSASSASSAVQFSVLCDRGGHGDGALGLWGRGRHGMGLGSAVVVCVGSLFLPQRTQRNAEEGADLRFSVPLGAPLCLCGEQTGWWLAGTARAVPLCLCGSTPVVGFGGRPRCGSIPPRGCPPPGSSDTLDESPGRGQAGQALTRGSRDDRASQGGAPRHQPGAAGAGAAQRP